MKKLIIVRHGDYIQNDEDFLSEKGRQQMAILGKKLKPICEGEMRVFSSPSLRASKSASLLMRHMELAGRPEINPLLFSGNPNLDPAADQVAEWVKSLPGDTVILVTHNEVTQELPLTFGRLALGMYGSDFRDGWSTDGVLKGHAFYINCEAKSIEEVQPTE